MSLPHAPPPTRVYVAGPYTKGDVAVNVRGAILAASELYDAGLMPYVPHLSHYWHTVAPRPYGDWLRLDMEWLRVCDVLLRLPGESSGADKEVCEAVRLGIPCFEHLGELLTWALPQKPCRICGKLSDVVLVKDERTGKNIEAPCGPCVVSMVCP